MRVAVVMFFYYYSFPLFCIYGKFDFTHTFSCIYLPYRAHLSIYISEKYHHHFNPKTDTSNLHITLFTRALLSITSQTISKKKIQCGLTILSWLWFCIVFFTFSLDEEGKVHSLNRFQQIWFDFAISLINFCVNWKLPPSSYFFFVVIPSKEKLHLREIDKQLDFFSL